MTALVFKVPKMASLFILAVLALGVSCQHHNHDSEAIYHKVINDVWLSSDMNDDGMFERFELTAVFANYDDNGDKVVTRHEYVDSIDKHSVLRDYTNAVFNEFDANNDHTLDDPDIDLVYAKMDKDGNKEVSKEEFTEFWLDILHRTAHLHGHGLHLGHH